MNREETIEEKINNMAEKIFDWCSYQKHSFHFDTARHIADFVLSELEKKQEDTDKQLTLAKLQAEIDTAENLLMYFTSLWCDYCEGKIENFEVRYSEIREIFSKTITTAKQKLKELEKDGGE